MGYSRFRTDSSPASPLALRAIALVVHGSRDPRPRQAAELLASRLSIALAAAETRSIVGVMQLDCTPSPLHVQLVEFAQRARSAGAQRIEIVPLFLSLGIHSTVDVPEEVALATQTMGAAWDDRWQLYPALGVWPGIDRVLVASWHRAAVGQPGRSWVLMAHGSRNAAGNQLAEHLAERLGMSAAYWAIEPKLSDRLTELAAADHRDLGVLPYFLFAGSLTEAIERQIQAWQVDRPEVTVQWLEPIGPSPELVDLIAGQLLDEFNQ